MPRTHEFLKASWQPAGLAATYLDVLKQHIDKIITLGTNCTPGSEVTEWTNTHIFDQGGEDSVCAAQFPQQCDGAGSRQQGRLDQLI